MIKEWLKNVVRQYLPVYKYESGTLKILYAGYSPIKKNYYVRMLLNNPGKSVFSGFCFYRKIPGLLKRYDSDMIISEISPAVLDKFRKYRGYIIPEWATMKINLERPMTEICARKISDFPDVKRLIRKYNLTYEIRTDIESIQFFYDKMYLPFTKSRHGNEAWILDINMILKSSPPPEMISIMENGVTVGASLIQKENDEWRLLYLGTIDGNQEYLRHGVIGAIYYFAILEAKKTGYKRLNVGGSRPFVNDGLTRYKLGLGAEFVPELTPFRYFLWLGVNENSSMARKFIESNPFMHLGEGYKLIKSGVY